MALVVIVFLAFFLAAALVLFAIAGRRTEEGQQALSRLQKMSLPQSADTADSLDLRRVEHSSGLPWLDRLMDRLAISQRCQLLLYQADVPWTAAKLLLISVIIGCC